MQNSEKEKTFVLFPMRSCRNNGSFSHFWVQIYLVQF